jgi:molybdate transport system regulatory protein
MPRILKLRHHLASACRRFVSDRPVLGLTMAKLTLRIDFETADAIGPGKIRLLEHVRDTGSISAAGRAMDMSYRRAWLLVDMLNNAFREPVVSTKLGGKAGGGAVLTRFGEELVRSYREMELVAHAALRPHLVRLEAAIAPARDRSPIIRPAVAPPPRRLKSGAARPRS